MVFQEKLNYRKRNKTAHNRNTHKALLPVVWMCSHLHRPRVREHASWEELILNVLHRLIHRTQ